MKKVECVYRELLFQTMEKKAFRLTQAGLADELNLSLSTVNLALVPLRRMNAVDVQNRGLVVKDMKKILLYWASIRNVEKDVVYATRSDKPIRTIEAEMPAGAVFAGFSAYKFRFKDVPADYSEVYVYADEAEIRRRFPPNDRPANIIVLAKDERMARYGKSITVAQLFVDIWNMRQWYARDYLQALEVRLDGLLA